MDDCDSNRIPSLVPGPLPLFCQGQGSAGRTRSTRLILALYGDAKHKRTVSTALQKELELTARPVTVLASEPKDVSHAELVKLVGPKKDAQVLGVELSKDGGASLWLFDGATEKTGSVPSRI